MNPSPKFTLQMLDLALTAAGTAGGSGATYYIDTLGYDFASFDVITQTTTGTYSELQLMEADATTSASFAAITALTGGTETSTSAGFVIGSSPTTSPWATKLNVDLRGRKRYLKVSAVPSVAGTFTVIANLFKGETNPVTASQTGVAAVANG